MSEILSVRNVFKSYGQQPVLQDVSLSVGAGEIMGLLGPNGAGKSTLIRIINNILSVDSGFVWIKNKPLNEHTQAQIGYLPEERGLYKKMTVHEQLMYLGRLKGLSAAQAKLQTQIWYDKLEVGAWRTKKVEEISKGMQQKIQFIATVLHRPDLLISDEPFSGFDPVNAALITKQVLDLKKQGVCIILSTHNMASVEELCDHIALINQGKIIVEGPVDLVRKQFSSDILELVFQGDVLLFSALIQKYGQSLSILEQGDTHCATLRLSHHHSIKEFLQIALHDFEIYSFRTILPSMNEIFLKAVNRNAL